MKTPRSRIGSLSVPAILILCALLPVALLVHLLRRRPKGGWLLPILTLPGTGALLYFLLKVWDVALSRARVPARNTVTRAVIPGGGAP